MVLMGGGANGGVSGGVVAVGCNQQEACIT